MGEEDYYKQLRKAMADVIVARHRYVEWLVSCGMTFNAAYRYVRNQESPDAVRIELNLRKQKENEEEGNHRN